MNMLKSTLKLSLLLLVAFALPVYAQGSVQGVLDSYLNALGPPKFVCGVGLRHSNFKNQPSQLETDTLAKIHQYATPPFRHLFKTSPTPPIMIPGSQVFVRVLWVSWALRPHRRWFLCCKTARATCLSHAFNQLPD
mgnify:CR=1 FL=1